MALAVFAALALATSPVAPATTPEAAAAAFIESFRAMDEARFDSFLASDATMFFPDGPFPRARVEGRDAVLSAFHSFFARVRGRGRTTLNITPLDEHIQRYGEVAIVSFRLEAEGAVGRRSVILHRSAAGWRIVHFHASTIDN